MGNHLIVCELTDAEEAVINDLSTSLSITPDAFFQRFWDGYLSGEVFIKGSLRSQVDQWIADKAKSLMNGMSAAEAVIKLSV